MVTASLAGQSLEKERVNQSSEESEPESRKGWTRVCISVNKSLEKGELDSEKSEPEPSSDSGQDWASLEKSESESWKKVEKEWTRVCKCLSGI